MKKSGSNISGWDVVYHPIVLKHDIPALSLRDKDRVKKIIENKLMTDPVLYGTPLRGTLRQFWKIRSGDVRIVFQIVAREVQILVIAYRKDVYQLAERRI